MSQDLLLEIGTEEIPAGFMEQIFTDLADLAAELFKQERIVFSEVKTTGTPRRIALYITDLADKQEDLKKEVRGPAKNIAYDDAGELTKAGSGFARGQGIEPTDLEIRDTENGKYVFASQLKKGQQTVELLPEILVKLMESLNFAKAMRWGNQETRFIRPIRWLLAAYGEEIIEFELAGVKSGNLSVGHRFLGQDQIEINSASEYFTKLAQEYVIVDHKQREKMILSQLKEIEVEKEVEIIIEPDLLAEVVHLIEYPTALYGEFEAEFLALPDEVLITSMKEHQRYFPVTDDSGELINMFITVRNGDDKGIENVKSGNEKVLRARLADAIFFYENDQQKDLAEKVNELKNIIFHEGLGTVYDKVKRMEKLVKDLAEKLRLEKSEVKIATRAAYLSKADLVTEMVNEFAKLQGVMGREYALLSGEDQATAEAIFEHYLPKSSGDDLPTTKAGALVSIADKIDNIVACFNLGLIPTGSKDPYALRRQAQGIIDIIVDAKLELELEELINLTLAKLAAKDNLKRAKVEIVADIKEFFKLRLENLLSDNQIRYDVAAAVLASDFKEVNDLLLRAEQLMEFRAEDDFAELITAFKRVSNLATKKDEEFSLNEDYFVDASEQKLHQKYLAVKKEVKRLVKEQNYKDALAEISDLKPLIDEFFATVMVMDDEQKIKNNRLTLLDNIAKLPKKIADLTEIAVD